MDTEDNIVAGGQGREAVEVVASAKWILICFICAVGVLIALKLVNA